MDVLKMISLKNNFLIDLIMSFSSLKINVQIFFLGGGEFFKPTRNNAILLNTNIHLHSANSLCTSVL